MAFVARELAPAGPRSGPQNGPAAQSSGSKLPRHRVTCAEAFSRHDSDKPQSPAACGHPAIHR
ncbi:hypothetical protein EJA72_16200 [Pseudomonas sp. PB120]|nr:hypothetical protein [Pseudomonas sp. PB120]